MYERSSQSRRNSDRSDSGEKTIRRKYLSAVGDEPAPTNVTV